MKNISEILKYIVSLIVVGAYEFITFWIMVGISAWIISQSWWISLIVGYLWVWLILWLMRKILEWYPFIILINPFQKLTSKSIASILFFLSAWQAYRTYLLADFSKTAGFVVLVAWVLLLIHKFYYSIKFEYLISRQIRAISSDDILDTKQWN